MACSRYNFAFVAALLCVDMARSDDLLYTYEGDVVPYDPSAGWIGGGCEDTCHESLEDGSFVLKWPEAGDFAAYHYWIARPPAPPPPSLWVEWRFRSNHPLPRHSYTCDANFKVQFANIFDLVFMYGDAVVSFSGSDFVWHLPNNEFRTYRFESPDGVNYWFSVDGLIFRTSYGKSSNGSSFAQFVGSGGCLDDQIPDMENAWDFVRYGTISYGEQIVASDAPAGFVDARRFAPLDRFTITYDSPNYVYINDVTVAVTSLGTETQRHEGTEGNDKVQNSKFKVQNSDSSINNRQSTIGNPAVVATRRLDNGPTDVVEIVLDRPIPFGATTRFTFDDGTLAQTLEFTFSPGDADGDGRADLADFAYFQNCFGVGTVLSNPTPCAALDSNADGDIDLADFYGLQRIFAGP